METTLSPPKTERQLLYEHWIEALRSGEYSQTKRRLKDHTGYCCLGVAGSAVFLLDEELELLDKLFLNPLHLEKLGIYEYLSKGEIQYILTKFKTMDELSDKVIRRYSVLTYLNDLQLFDFNQIADFLEDMAEKFGWDAD